MKSESQLDLDGTRAVQAKPKPRPTTKKSFRCIIL